jgi:hypothetical protein
MEQKMQQRKIKYKFYVQYTFPVNITVFNIIKQKVT